MKRELYVLGLWAGVVGLGVCVSAAPPWPEIPVPLAPVARQPAAAAVPGAADVPLFTDKDPLFTAAKSIQHWWPGEGHALDLVGQRHATLKNGAKFGPGRVGEAFTFDGVQAYVDCGAGNPSMPADAFTLMMWFRAEKQPGFQYLAFCWGETGMDISVNNIEPGVVAGNLGRGVGWDQFRGVDWEGANAVYDPYGQWHQVAIAYDGRRISNYRDGKLAKDIAWNIYTPSNTPLWLGGSDHETGCAPYKGQVQDVALFTRALSAGEMAAVYEAQTALPPRGMKEEDLLKFDDALNGETAPLAWYAAQRMPAGGEAAVAHLAQAARAATKPAAGVVAGLIKDLDADAYERREQGTNKLRQMGRSIEGELKAALATKPSLEATMRLQGLLDGFREGTVTFEDVRQARVKAIVTRIGAEAARRAVEAQK